MYPEHDKLKAVQDESQAIGEFLQHMSTKGYCLASYPEGEDRLYPFSRGTENLLAEYFGIDLNKLEKEKLHMLDEIRKANAPLTPHEQEIINEMKDEITLDNGQETFENE